MINQSEKITLNGTENHTFRVRKLAILSNLRKIKMMQVTVSDYQFNKYLVHQEIFYKKFILFLSMIYYKVLFFKN